MIEAARQFVRKLGERMKIEELALDEDGYCCVGFDDVTVNIEYEDERNELLLYAKVGEAPSDLGALYLEELLDLGYSAMMTTGGTLGVDRAAGSIMFADRGGVGGMDEHGFEKFVESFVNRAEDWSQLLTSPEFLRNVSEGPDLGEVGEMMRI